MEILDEMLKAACLGLSGVGMPLAVLACLIYGSLKDGTRSGGLLFCGHLIVSAAAGLITFFGGGGIFSSSALGAILNFAGAACAASVGVSLIVSVFRDHVFMDKEAFSQAEPEPEYQDISSQTASFQNFGGAVKQTRLFDRFFLWGLVFTLTDVNWLLWISVSAKSLTVQAYEAGGGGLFGWLIALAFLSVFVLFEMILYLVLSKLISLFQKVLAHWVFRLVAGLCGGLLAVCAVWKITEMIQNLRMLSF